MKYYLLHIFYHQTWPQLWYMFAPSCTVQSGMIWWITRVTALITLSYWQQDYFFWILFLNPWQQHKEGPHTTENDDNSSVTLLILSSFPVSMYRLQVCPEDTAFCIASSNPRRCHISALILLYRSLVTPPAWYISFLLLHTSEASPQELPSLAHNFCILLCTFFFPE